MLHTIRTLAICLAAPLALGGCLLKPMDRTGESAEEGGGGEEGEGEGPAEGEGEGPAEGEGEGPAEGEGEGPAEGEGEGPAEGEGEGPAEGEGEGPAEGEGEGEGEGGPRPCDELSVHECRADDRCVLLLPECEPCPEDSDGWDDCERCPDPACVEAEQLLPCEEVQDSNTCQHRLECEWVNLEACACPACPDDAPCPPCQCAEPQDPEDQPAGFCQRRAAPQECDGLGEVECLAAEECTWIEEEWCGGGGQGDCACPACPECPEGEDCPPCPPCQCAGEWDPEACWVERRCEELPSPPPPPPPPPPEGPCRELGRDDCHGRPHCRWEMVDGDCDCRRAPGSDDWACDCDEGFGLCIPVGREDCHTFEAPEPCRFLPGCTEDWNGGQDCWCDPCDCDDARCDCDWPEEDCGGCDQPCGCGEGIAPRPLCVADLTRCGSILDPDACEAVAGCQPRWEQPVPDCDAEHDCPAVLLFTRCDPTD